MENTERKKKVTKSQALRTEKKHRNDVVDAKQTSNEPAPEINTKQVETLAKATDITAPTKATAPTVTPQVTETAATEAVKTPAVPTTPVATANVEKTKTFSDYLAEQRKNLTKEKTDAAKMQKYYALTDALGAIGKMGGVAIGGAIGGNVLDSAPKVEDYKESRGYLDAFEKAKQANDRLRKLDETEFQLAYNKQQRDEERAYKAEQDKIAREYSAAQAELNRQWQAEQQRITREWNQAVADKDFARQAELKKELTKMEQDFKLKYQKIANAHDTAIKNISKEIVNIQNSGGKKVPIGFKNGTGITVPKAYYDDMLEFFIGDDWDGHKVTKDNVKTYIRNHPDKVNAYLSMFGLGTSAETKTEATEETPNNEEVTPNNAPNFFYYNPITDSTIKSEFPLVGMEESSEYPNENKVRQVPAKKAAEAEATTEEEDELNAYLAQFE